MSILRAVAILMLVWPGTPHAEEGQAIEHQGVARHYLMHRATGKVGMLPLLIYLQGLRPGDWRNHTWLELDAAADREGFVAVYPEALQHRWNYTGQLSEKVKAGDAIADDVGFIAALIDQLVSQGVADPKRVYVIGESRGGLMGFELMCQLAGRIAAAGALITGMTEGQRDACAPAIAVPVFVLAGSADTMQAYDGFLAPTGRLLSVPETMEFWRVRHGCTGQKMSPLRHRIEDDPTSITLVQWTGCTIDDGVRLYRVDGGGHRVPSLTVAPEDDWAKKAGRQNHDIETIDAFWDFAKRFAKE
jgi:polyhydroxybutyrate depolymerase